MVVSRVINTGIALLPFLLHATQNGHRPIFGIKVERPTPLGGWLGPRNAGQGIAVRRGCVYLVCPRKAPARLYQSPQLYKRSGSSTARGTRSYPVERWSG